MGKEGGGPKHCLGSLEADLGSGMILKEKTEEKETSTSSLNQALTMWVEHCSFNSSTSWQLAGLLGLQ